MSLHSPSTSTSSDPRRQRQVSLKVKTVQRVYSVIEWLWYRMSFLKRKRVKFAVDLQVCHLSDVPLVNAVLFAKVRLLDGGAFEAHTERVEVRNHAAKWDRRFNFTCRIASDPNTGILERCPCRISLRKEQKGGKSYQKLGYVDINLCEFAASGVEGISRSYLLDGYGLNARQDNSKVAVKVTMSHQSADPFFKVPHLSLMPLDDSSLNPEGRRAPLGEEEEKAEMGGSKDEDADSMAYEGVAFRNHGCDVQGEGSGGSSSLCEDAASLASESRKTASSTLRRMSQDRSSAPRVQSTRIDAENVIASVLAGSRLSEDVVNESECGEGLALYLGKDGEAIIAPPSAVNTRHLERVHISADTSGHLDL
ncbi:hypothetical protein PFISCL1PPCAC_22948 [Pristionchus fissidentatus]|uniref:C2 NT-type domain-containing protein n=1 Tax=Pristionchus fissidentatus TaxID=1538716 RepID=A0AAV5WH97_9BILA|nr:hypothetical protein PFISCL1PPCAC_22948 [Pristionchus fissidentatus]